MPYTWERETITVSEISAILYDQYDGNPTISVPITNGGERFNYIKHLVPVQCNRCGNKYQISPALLLSMKEDRGYSCSKCGHMSDNELRRHLQVEQLKAGRKELEERGIDPDEESEEERQEREKEEEERQLAAAVTDAYSSEDAFEKITASEIEQNSPPPASPPSAPPLPAPSQPPPPVPAATQREQETVKEDDSVPEAGTKAAEASGTEKKEQTAKETDEIFASLFGDDLQETNEIGEIEESGIDIDDEEFDLSKFAGKDGDEDEGDAVEEDPLELDETDEGAIAGDEDEEGEEPEQESGDEEFIELNGKKRTFETLSERYNEIQDGLIKELGYIPYGNITYNNGRIEVPCKLCGKKFEIVDINILEDDKLVFTRESCDYLGIKFKGDLAISACPHCKQSILSKGYNEHYRKFVEDTIAKNKLNILHPESYWYASPNTSYLLEANGVKKFMNFVDLRTKYKDADMSKHELFTPKGEDTKSKAASVENGKNAADQDIFILPKHDPKGQYHFDAVETSVEEEFERQQKQAQSQMVFRPGEKNRKQKEDIAEVLDGFENPFERKEKLDAQFKKTKMYEFIKELANQCLVRFKVEINQKTFEIPVVDFEPYEQGMPGFRLICADFNKNSMFRVPFPKIAHTIPFQFNVKLNKKEGEAAVPFKYSVLYSDSVMFREKAAFNALVKYINPKILAFGGKRMQLEGNLTVQYTDNDDYLREFNEENSPFPDGKPCNKELGIVVSWVSSKEIDAKDVLETLAALENSQRKDASLNKLENEYSLYMACAIRYIEQFNEKNRKMCYTITEYIEHDGILIADGLYQCIKAICKEYYLNYPQLRDRTPYIVIEVDPNIYASPSLRAYIDRKSILPMDKIFRMQLSRKEDENDIARLYMQEPVKQYLRYVYARKEAYRNKYHDSDYMRQDIRKFNAVGLCNRMPDEIKAAGLQRDIFIDAQRYIFINNMGYDYANQLEIKEYFVHQGIIQKIMLDGGTILMSKMIDPDTVYEKSGIVGSSNDDTMTINSPFFNPAFRAKMDRIRNGYNVTPEAAEFYKNYMAQKQQQMMAAAWDQRMQQQQQYTANMWQQRQQQQPKESPLMTPGAYRMPDMPGM